MADEKEPKAEKKAKKTVPEAPKEPPVTLPTPHEIREAKKAELVSMSEKFGLEAKGKVDDLRKRLLAYVAKQEAKAAPRGSEAEGEEAHQAREERGGEEGRGGKGGAARAPPEAEAQSGPPAAPRPACLQGGSATEVPPPGMVPIQEVRRRMAKAPGRAVETASPLRISVEPPVDRLSGPAGGPRLPSERVP